MTCHVHVIQTTFVSSDDESCQQFSLYSFESFNGCQVNGTWPFQIGDWRIKVARGHRFYLLFILTDDIQVSFSQSFHSHTHRMDTVANFFPLSMMSGSLASQEMVAALLGCSLEVGAALALSL